MQSFIPGMELNRLFYVESVGLSGAADLFADSASIFQHVTQFRRLADFLCD